MRFMQIRQIKDKEEQMAELGMLAEEYPEVREYLSKKSP